MDEILACADSASQAAESAKKSEQNAVAASHNAVSNANTAESFANQAQTHAENARLSASSAANLANGALQAQRAAEAAAERAEAASALSQGPIQGGMTADAKAALMAVVESIAVFTVNNPRELIDNLRNALYSDPVASIRAVYTQSRTVYASDSLDVLRDDLVVTAVHTDGSSTVRTDYTLSGTLAAGTSVITAALDGKTAMFEVNVAAARIPATGIALSSTALNITAGEPVQLMATLEPADSTDTVVWASSEEAVATVSQYGTVKPIASGSCSITATAGEVSASCAVTVAMPLTGYNFGNPYLNYVNADPTTLGKTDEELRGKFYKAQYNDCAKALNGGASANFTAILLYPMSSGTYYVRTVNRSRVPSNKFMISALCCLQATGCWHKGFSQWKRLHRL